jgi:hypothetical protein
MNGFEIIVLDDILDKSSGISGCDVHGLRMSVKNAIINDGPLNEPETLLSRHALVDHMGLKCLNSSKGSCTGDEFVGTGGVMVSRVDIFNLHIMCVKQAIGEKPVHT